MYERRDIRTNSGKGYVSKGVYSKKMVCTSWGIGYRRWNVRKAGVSRGRSRAWGGLSTAVVRILIVLAVVGLTAMMLGIFPEKRKTSAAMASTTVIPESVMVEESSAGMMTDDDEMCGVESDYTSEEYGGQEAEQNPVSIPCIVIDAGHGGIDEGCSGTEAQEKDINLAIALHTRDLLLEKGFRVLLTREDDTYMSLEERVLFAKEADADAYVSIHQNTYETGSVHGIETWCQEGSDEATVRFTQLVHKYVLDFTGANDREVKYNGDLYVTRENTMPTCLVETGFLSNSEEQKLLMQEAYQEKIAKGIAAGVNLYFYPKTMYLTFDDGPSAENTSKVLDILAEKDVKATFFVVGENVRKNPEVAKRIVAEGHTIGIHCNTHEYDVIYKSVESYLEDFMAAYDAVFEVTGVKAQLFRFPGGSVNAYNKSISDEIIKEMTDRGFLYYDWNASLEDAVKKNDPEKLLENARESTLRRKKVVMLAHDIVYNTTLCLEDLIDQFPEYRFEALTKGVVPIQF